MLAAMYWVPVLIAFAAGVALVVLMLCWRRLPASRMPLAVLLTFTVAGSLAFGTFYEWRPSEAVVDRVEMALVRHPCAGRLVTKHREYSYGLTDHAGEPNLHWIEFQLRTGRPPGRLIRGPGVERVDEEREHTAVGHFDLDAGLLSVMFCNADRPLRA